MAIRPTDFQGSILQSVQSAGLTQRADEAPHQAALAAQAAFAADVAKREETIEATDKSQGNKVGAKPQEDRRQSRDRKRRPGEAFEEVVEEAAGSDEPAHLIDFTA
jgi:hypothetical protein